MSADRIRQHHFIIRHNLSHNTVVALPLLHGYPATVAGVLPELKGIQPLGVGLDRAFRQLATVRPV